MLLFCVTEETEPDDKVPKEVEFKSLRDTKELAAPRPESMRISEEEKSEDQDSSKDLKEEAESEEKKSAEVSADQTDEVVKKGFTDDLFYI